MIVADDISKRFGRTRAVDRVSFTLEPGQIAGLLGPNGAGKSTTIRMVTGFLCPDDGRVRIGSFDTTTHPGPARRQLGYLPEAAPCYPEMRAIDYLIYRARLNGLARREARTAAAKAATRCRIDAAMSRKRFGALSKGYRQRVGLAAAIVHNPEVLVLDEPTNGLDPAQIRDARSLIRDLARDRTMLVSSHILPEIERTCDRVIIIAGGRIRADGSPAELAGRLPTKLRVEFKPAAGTTPMASVGQLPGIHTASLGTTPDGWTVLTASCTADANTRVAELLFRAGAHVRTLTAQVPSLEDAFVHVTEAADDGAGS